MSFNILMFSIALNGYDFIYRQCIESHRSYLAKQSYEYVLVNKFRYTKYSHIIYA